MREGISTANQVRAVLEGGPANGRQLPVGRAWPSLHVESDDGGYVWVYDLAAYTAEDRTALYTWTARPGSVTG